MAVVNRPSVRGLPPNRDVNVLMPVSHEVGALERLSDAREGARLARALLPYDQVRVTLLRDHPGGVHPLSIERQHLLRSVDGGHVSGVLREPLRPPAGAACQLEDGVKGTDPFQRPESPNLAEAAARLPLFL